MDTEHRAQAFLAPATLLQSWSQICNNEERHLCVADHLGGRILGQEERLLGEGRWHLRGHGHRAQLLLASWRRRVDFHRCRHGEGGRRKLPPARWLPVWFSDPVDRAWCRERAVQL